MKIVCDLGSTTKYNKRNLVNSQSGKHWYPSKKMFVEFLKQYKDVRGIASIWSVEDWSDGTVTINVELKYRVANLPRGKK